VIHVSFLDFLAPIFEHFYHGLEHIKECFAELYKLIDAGLIENEESMRIALWYHDYFQNHTADDEERSALKAYDAAISLGYDEAFAKIVRRLVLVTKHGMYFPETNDEQFMCDIDLTGFAAEDFQARTDRVRMEYPDVPLEAFIVARRGILRGFMDRPHIYYTPYYQKRCEAKARQNLNDAIDGCRHGVSYEHRCFECKVE
jgi:predicted metal-dependent HD superfamily phosphohydrolase